MTYWIFLGASLILLVLSICSGVSNYSWIVRGYSYEGRIVELVEKKSRKKGNDSTFAPRVTFNTGEAEEEFISSTSSSSSPYTIGDIVKIVVSKDMLRKSIANFGEIYGFSFIGGIIGISISSISIVLIFGDRIFHFIHPNL